MKADMESPFRIGWARGVRYVNTPLHFFALCFIALSGILAVFGYLNFPEFSIYILLAMLGFILIIVVVFLAFSPTRLQFTATDLMAWKQMELGDSDTDSTYNIETDTSAKSPRMISNKRKKIT